MAHASPRSIFPNMKTFSQHSLVYVKHQVTLCVTCAALPNLIKYVCAGVLYVSYPHKPKIDDLVRVNRKQ